MSPLAVIISLIGAWIIVAILLCYAICRSIRAAKNPRGRK